MHIAIIGAAGKIGRVALQHLMLTNKDSQLRLTLVAHTLPKTQGLLYDIQSAMPMRMYNGLSSSVEPVVSVTEDFLDIKGADMVIIAAAITAPRQAKEEFKKYDPTGRLVHSYYNCNLMREACEQVSLFAPEAHVLVVTNQSDMMSMLAREYISPTRVLGFGGMIDSARFRYLMSHAVASEKEGASPHEERGHIVGYHTDDMIPLSESVTNRSVSRDIYEQVLDKTRKYGAYVSALQKDPLYPDISSSPSISIGYALYLAMCSFTGQAGPLQESFNIVLEDDAISRSWGVPARTSLSVPIRLRQGGYDILTEHRATPEEKRHFMEAQKNMTASYARLVAISEEAGITRPVSSYSKRADTYVL